MAIPAWVERLRSASFESPEGVISNFKVDTYSRVGGKKASNHEILNTDISIPQDQGNRSISYPIEAYFTGENGDIESDAFFRSLGESYSIENYGILHHPRWGDIPVMPFEFQQSENAVSEGGIFRITVDFRPIPLTDFPTTNGVNESEVVSDVNDLEEVTDEANSNILTRTAAAYAQFSNRIRGIVNVVRDTIGTIAEQIQDIKDVYDKIIADIDAALAIAADVQSVMSQVNKLIRVAANAPDNTTGKVTAYYKLSVGIAGVFANFFDSTSDNILKLNNGIIFQSLTSMASGALAEAAMSTDFQTRDSVGVGIDLLTLAVNQANEGSAINYQTIVDNSTSGIVSDQFAPDHNTGSTLGILYAKAIALLLVRSFDLKAKQTIFLSGPSDAITLTWKYYKDLERLEFFMLTNSLQDGEFSEIPAGREIVVYV